MLRSKPKPTPPIIKSIKILIFSKNNNLFMVILNFRIDFSHNLFLIQMFICVFKDKYYKFRLYFYSLSQIDFLGSPVFLLYFVRVERQATIAGNPTIEINKTKAL